MRRRRWAWASASRGFRARRALSSWSIARDLATAIAETIIRDRFEGAAERVLEESEIGDWVVAEISAARPLTVLDLRATGLLRLGVSTDAARAKAHREGQMLSEHVHSAFAVDGLLYASRLTGG